MGWLKTEGEAVDVVVPAGQDLTKGELYRIDKWNGIAMSTVLHTDPELGLALECGWRIWYVQIPAALSGAVRGDVLWWSTGEGFKSGATDLVAAGTTGAIGPACKVEEAPDANNIAGVRVLNIA